MKKFNTLIAAASLALTAQAEPTALYAIQSVPSPTYAYAVTTEFQAGYTGSTTFAAPAPYNTAAIHARPNLPAAAAGPAVAPANSTLMLAGLGALGLVARRRLA